MNGSSRLSAFPQGGGRGCRERSSPPLIDRGPVWRALWLPFAGRSRTRNTGIVLKRYFGAKNVRGAVRRRAGLRGCLSCEGSPFRLRLRRAASPNTRGGDARTAEKENSRKGTFSPQNIRKRQKAESFSFLTKQGKETLFCEKKRKAEGFAEKPENITIGSFFKQRTKCEWTGSRIDGGKGDRKRMAGRFPSEWIDEVRDKSRHRFGRLRIRHAAEEGRQALGALSLPRRENPFVFRRSEKQMFYCFGCHAGGNVITFVMNIEHMEFPEAVRHLAERAHMPIPELQRGEDTGPKKDRDRLYAALVEAAKFYHKTLYTPDGAQALEYLHNRGIRDNVIRHFGLGATARGWSSLYAHLSDMGFAKQELIDANLALERGGKVFDAFRERVMFPIFDPRGRVTPSAGASWATGSPNI